MPTSAPTVPAATVSTAAIGAALALGTRVLQDVCGAGPAAMIGGMTAAFLALGLLPAARGPWVALAVVGGGFFWGFERLGALLGPHLDLRVAVGLLDLLACAALFSPLAGPRPAAGPGAHLLGAAVGALVFVLDRDLAAPLTVVLVITAARARPAGAPAPAWRVARSTLALGALGLGLLGWSLARAPLDPTGAGWAVLGVALAVGSALVGVPALIAGAALLGGAWAAWAAGPAWIDTHLERLAGPILAAAFGLGAGALIGAARPGRAFGPATTLAFAAAGWLLPALPAAVTLPATRALASFGENALARGRTEALRADSSLREGGIGAAGATALWSRDRAVFAELDGTAADPTSRAGDAETFAGALGACVAGGRDRARVAGDDLVLVTRALVAQGFRGVDVAVPDRRFARALADTLPSVAQTWLTPAPRAVGATGPMLLRLGAPADLVVEVARAGWTDGRTGVPDRRGFAAVRRTLRPDGVYVLALGTTRLAPGDFPRVVADLLASFADVTVWSPPAGVDTALFVARTESGPLPWSRLTGCVAADPDGFRALGLRNAPDVAGRLVGGAEALRKIAVAGHAPLTLPTVQEEPPLPLLGLDAAGFDPAGWFDADAPAAELRARHTSQGEFFALLRDRDSASIQEAITRARVLGAGNSQIVATLLRPHLDRARAAMTRAAAEGLGSHGWQEAETALANAELIAPGFGETACVRGRLAELKSDVVQAEAAFQACVAADPENLVGLDGVARTARIRGDLPAAEAALRKAHAVAPDRMSTAFNLGQLLVVAGKGEEAERMLKTASRLAAAESPTPAAPNIALAYLYLSTGRPALAQAEAERAKALDPGAEPRMLAGAARLELGDLRGADTELRAALAIDPDYVPARGELGRVQARAGQYALAAESFKAVLEQEPGNARARENLRAALAAMGTPEAGDR